MNEIQWVKTEISMLKGDQVVVARQVPLFSPVNKYWWAQEIP